VTDTQLTFDEEKLEDEGRLETAEKRQVWHTEGWAQLLLPLDPNSEEFQELLTFIPNLEPCHFLSSSVGLLGAEDIVIQEIQGQLGTT
jgi:hypothetical protein